MQPKSTTNALPVADSFGAVNTKTLDRDTGEPVQAAVSTQHCSGDVERNEQQTNPAAETVRKKGIVSKLKSMFKF